MSKKKLKRKALFKKYFTRFEMEMLDLMKNDFTHEEIAAMMIDKYGEKKAMRIFGQFYEKLERITNDSTDNQN